jgi:hypothetical protein
MNKYYIIYIFIFLLILPITSCRKDDDLNLPSVEQRAKQAIENLKNELTAPANGWKLLYQPNVNSGSYPVFFKFNADGTMRIQSDFLEDDGKYFDQTITYRIDNSLGVELIFETYTLFHYLFEQDQAFYGGEFEFIFDKKEGNNLIFKSKSDVSDRTILTFEPAIANESSQFSREVIQNLKLFRSPSQQLNLNDQDIAVFWNMDLFSRSIQITGAALLDGSGNVVEAQMISLSHSTGFLVLNSKLILEDPIAFTINSKNIGLSEITLNTFGNTTYNFCSLGSEQGPKYDGSFSNGETATLLSSVFDPNGGMYEEENTGLSSISVYGIYDEIGASLGANIENDLPGVLAYQFYYNYDLGTPFYAVGFVLSPRGSNTSTRFYLKRFQPTVMSGNTLSVQFTGQYLTQGDPPTADELNSIDTYLGKIFEGGSVKVFKSLSQDGLYRFYNPCSKYLTITFAN